MQLAKAHNRTQHLIFEFKLHQEDCTGYDWLIYLEGRYMNQETGWMEALFNELSLLLLCVHELLIINYVFEGSCYCKNAPAVHFLSYLIAIYYVQSSNCIPI